MLVTVLYMHPISEANGILYCLSSYDVTCVYDVSAFTVCKTFSQI